jgi:hypothetical protein
LDILDRVFQLIITTICSLHLFTCFCL